VAPITVSAAMYFAGHSPYWGGAVSYLDPTRDDAAATLAVARRITIGQFSDIVAQECGGVTLSADVPLADVMATGRVDVGGAYGTVVALGDLDGEPVVTCTARGRRRAATPTPDYLATIRTGLAQWWPAVVVNTYLDDVYTTAMLAATRAARPRQLTLAGSDRSWRHDDHDRAARLDDPWDRLDDPWGDHIAAELVAP